MHRTLSLSLHQQDSLGIKVIRKIQQCWRASRIREMLPLTAASTGAGAAGAGVWVLGAQPASAVSAREAKVV